MQDLQITVDALKNIKFNLTTFAENWKV
jgi:hypothetical protein